MYRKCGCVAFCWYCYCYWLQERTAWIDCPDPMVTPPNSKQKGASPAKCAADVKTLCDPQSFAQK